MAELQTITQKEIDEYNLLDPLLDTLFDEVKTFSSKKQDVQLNRFKVKTINRVLTRVKELIGTDPMSNFLDLLDEDELPTNSDAVLVMAQFQSALAKYKASREYHDTASYSTKWLTKDKKH